MRIHTFASALLQRTSKASSRQGCDALELRPGKKVRLNSKYVKTKQNRKLKAKFFDPVRVLRPVGKQAYKLELPKKLRIHYVSYVSLPEQDITRKGWVEETRLELKAGDDAGEILF